MNFKLFDKGITEENSFKILISLGNDLPNISFKCDQFKKKKLVINFLVLWQKLRFFPTSSSPSVAS